MPIQRTRLLSGSFAALLVLAACGRDRTRDVDSAVATDSPAAAPSPATASVATIETGKHIGADKRVTDATTTFAPRDTIYLVVVTENATASSMLTAKWTHESGKAVDSTTQAVAVAGTGMQAVTEFHMVKPGGWPTGKYTVEILLDGRSVGTKEIEVKAS